MRANQLLDIIEPEAVPALVSETDRAQLPVSNEIPNSSGVDAEQFGYFFRTEKPLRCGGGSHLFTPLLFHLPSYSANPFAMCGFPFDPMRSLEFPFG